jgi:tight adherence protein C
MIVGLTAGLLIAVQMGVSMGMGVLVVVGTAAGLSMIPNLILGQKVKKRTQEIRHALPNAIDLLEVCVSAGMGMDQAWNSTSEEMGEASQALADEMQLVNLEMLLGAKRSTALKSMADRSGADDLSNLASIISQADKFGTSVADALRTFAETMRESRSQKAEESAEKMAIKLLLPMVIFIFPVVLIVSAGPAALKMVELLSN